MSVTRETTIWCDEADCVEWITIDEERTPVARRKAAHESGWSREGSYDFCPAHTQKRKEKARAIRQSA